MFVSLGYKNLVWPNRVKHAAASLFNMSYAKNSNNRNTAGLTKERKEKSKWKKRTPESLKLVLTNYNYLYQTIKKKSRKNGLSEKYIGYPVSASELKCIAEQLESEAPEIEFMHCPIL